MTGPGMIPRNLRRWCVDSDCLYKWSQILTKYHAFHPSNSFNYSWATPPISQRSIMALIPNPLRIL
ncbi:hypothetical protein L208DRAFT_1395141 [Tricholoma matsutake]|nr:hypothetical protein L208DRAFT_1395141 [Tricholoma matsutake 945]